MENKLRTLEEDIEFNYGLQALINFDKHVRKGLISEDEIDSLNALDFIEYLLNESNEVHLLSNDIIKKIYLVTSYYLYDYPKVTRNIRKRCHDIITLTNRIVAGERDLEKIKIEVPYRVNLDSVSYIESHFLSFLNHDLQLLFY